MNKIFKAVTLVLILAGTASAEVDIVGDLKTLNDKKSQEFNADKWIQEYAEERKFDKTKWENLYKREYEKNYQYKKNQRIRKGQKTEHTELDLFAKYLTFCTIKDTFRKEKNSFIMETSSQGKEMQEYRDYLYKQCELAEKNLDNYYLEKKSSK